jgi:hypothetical protein
LMPIVISAANLGDAERIAEAGLVADGGTPEATPAG